MITYFCKPKLKVGTEWVNKGSTCTTTTTTIIIIIITISPEKLHIFFAFVADDVHCGHHNHLAAITNFLSE